mgnify:CR=1 FL=1
MVAEKRLAVPFPQAFIAMLRAAKNATPQPASGVCLPLLEEVEACGHTVTRELYHLAMDVCRAGGHWRRALQIFNRMSHQGIPPTTHTYALLEQAGAAARNSEPHEVYEAMKYAGVPAYLSYTAATAKAMAFHKADEGKVADWLGRSTLPLGSRAQALRADQLSKGGTSFDKAQATAGLHTRDAALSKRPFYPPPAKQKGGKGKGRGGGASDASTTSSSTSSS